MTVDPQQAKGIFLDAVERHAPAEWADYLQQACGDDAELRQWVAELLAAHGGDDSLLDRASTGRHITMPLTEGLPISERPGTRIGPYKLLEKIGEGGMGVVYMAEQQEPVARRVALKIIKPGMDTQQVIAQFEAERQALALMDHPNIAKVFDAGTTGPASGCPGRPYFVMELIHGIPVTQFCDQQHLTARERLELFIPICQAVQHAHQKGIIHRDLKPSNILIALYDGRPVPKVIDFGVAKAISQKLTEKTAFTGLGQIVGTLDYMSPEQAQPNQLDIDTRSDVYSLGVVLYELLAGDTPFDKRRLRSAAWDEMLRIIREEEPPKPSTKLSSSDTLASVAANRKIEPAKLSALVRGELDWIVMQALEKDRARRYETASALAADIQHYLHDEAVVACPPSTLYRFKKFARRNRTVLVTSTLISLALIAGTTVSVWQAIAAQRARRNAEANFRLARKAVDDTFKTLAEEPRLQEVELHALRRDLLTRVLPFYEAFIEQRSDDPALEAERAKVYRQLAVLHRELNEPEAVVTNTDMAAEIAAHLSAAYPGEPTYRHLRAKSFIDKGWVLDDAGKPTEALAEFQAARELLEPLASEWPGTADYAKDLANVYYNLGVVFEKQSKLADAEAEQRKAVKIWQTCVAEDAGLPESRAELAINRNRLAQLLVERGQLPEALQELYAGLELREKLAAEFPNRVDYRSAPGGSRLNLGVCYYRMGDWVRAEAEFRAAVEIQSALIADFPQLRGLRSGLTNVQSNLIMVLREQGKFAEAETQYRIFASFWESQVAQYPHLPEYRQRLVHTHENLGDVLSDQGQFAEAASEYLAALKLGASLVELYPGRAEFQEDIASCHNSLAYAYRGMEKPAEALAEIQAAIQIRETLVTQNPEVVAYRGDLGTGHDDLGLLLMTAGKYSEARAAYGRARQLYQALVSEFPQVPTYLRDLAQVHVKLGVLADYEDNHDQAGVEFRKAQEILQQAARSLAASPDFLVELGGNLCNLGNSLREDQRPADALEFYGQAIETLEGVLVKEPQIPRAQKFLANAFAARALVLSELDRVAESLQDADRALQLAEPADRATFVLMRARCLARQSTERATAEVEQLLQQIGDGSTLYDAACFYAQLLVRETDTETCERFAVRALELLRQAQSLGHFQNAAEPVNVNKDTDLDPIRNREDFRQWLSEMEKQDPD